MMWVPGPEILGAWAFVRLYWREITIGGLVLICGAQHNCIGGLKLAVERYELAEQTRQLKASAAANRLGIEMQAAHERADIYRVEAEDRAADTIAEIERATTPEEVLEALLRGTTHESD